MLQRYSDLSDFEGLPISNVLSRDGIFTVVAPKGTLSPIKSCAEPSNINQSGVFETGSSQSAGDPETISMMPRHLTL
jgi:hypothetical protein